MQSDREQKYRFSFRTFVAPIHCLFQFPVCCFFSFLKTKRISVQRSETNLASCKTVPYLFKIFILISFFSCEKVIDINLNEADKKIVIEGNLSNISGSPAEIKVSQTKAFEEDNNFNGISGATVTIHINDTTYTLAENSAGIYRTNACKGVPGSTYQLAVTINGVTYTSTSFMPLQLVSLDTLTVEDLAFGGSSNLTIYPSYKDPPGPGNSYRLVEYQNGVQIKRVFAQNDEISDGLIITRPLINPDGDLKKGDTVRVDLQCIDPAIYKYWFSLDESATGENQSATPTNPITNISGGALGYFSAYSVSSYTIAVP